MLLIACKLMIAGGWQALAAFAGRGNACHALPRIAGAGL